METLQFVSAITGVDDIIHLEPQQKGGVNVGNAWADMRQTCLKKGKEIGETQKLIELVCKKLRKNKSVEIIAEELEEDITFIKEICQVAQNFAPDYDCQSVYEAWEEQQKAPTLS